jgi:hypothetical protein
MNKRLTIAILVGLALSMWLKRKAEASIISPPEPTQTEVATAIAEGVPVSEIALPSHVPKTPSDILLAIQRADWKALVKDPAFLDAPSGRYPGETVRDILTYFLVQDPEALTDPSPWYQIEHYLTPEAFQGLITYTTRRMIATSA